MNRYRWFRAEWPISMRQLAKRLKAKQFADGSTDGFVVDRVRDDYVEARYIERFEVEEVVTDPFGKELTFQRVEFKQSAIRASGGTVGLELRDAPRSTHGLVSRLSEANDFSLAIIPISVDVVAWATSFQQLSRLEVIVDSLQIGDLELGSGVSAKIVVKGAKDVRNYSKVLTSGRRHKVEKVQVRFSGAYVGRAVLAHQGAVAIGASRSDAIAEILRESLGGLLK